MPFRPPKKPPQFADLKGILAQTKREEEPTYQLLAVLIDRLTQLQLHTTDELKKKTDEVDAARRFATKFGTFLTKEDDSTALPNSYQLLAGTGITLDYSVLNKLTISSSGGGGYAPMSTGAEPLEIMSDGAGSVFMVGFSE